MKIFWVDFSAGGVGTRRRRFKVALSFERGFEGNFEEEAEEAGEGGLGEEETKEEAGEGGLGEGAEEEEAEEAVDDDLGGSGAGGTLVPTRAVVAVAGSSSRSATGPQAGSSTVAFKFSLDMARHELGGEGFQIGWIYRE